MHGQANGDDDSQFDQLTVCMRLLQKSVVNAIFYYFLCFACLCSIPGDSGQTAACSIFLRFAALQFELRMVSQGCFFSDEYSAQ